MRTLVCRGGGRKQLKRVWTMDQKKKKKGKRRTTISEMNGGDASRHTTQEEKISVGQ